MACLVSSYIATRACKSHSNWLQLAGPEFERHLRNCGDSVNALDTCINDELNHPDGTKYNTSLYHPALWSLMSKLLSWSPHSRPTAEEALQLCGPIEFA